MPNSADDVSPQVGATYIALTILVVSDVQRSAAFYAAACGWQQSVDAAPAYAEFRIPGGSGLGLYRRSDFEGTAGARAATVADDGVGTAEIYLRVDDMDAAMAALTRAGARALSPRADRPWGDDAAYYADPDGHVVAVSRPLAEHHD